MQILSTINCSTILFWPFLLRNYTVIFFLPKTIQIIYKRPFLKTLQQFKRSAKKADKRKTVFKKRSVFMMFSFSTVRKKKEEKIIRATLNGIEGCMKEGIIAFVEKRKQASTWLWTWSKVADITLTKTVENAHIKYKDGRRRKNIKRLYWTIKPSCRHSRHHSTSIRELEKGQKRQKYSTSKTSTCHVPLPTFQTVAPQCTASSVLDEKQNRHEKKTQPPKKTHTLKTTTTTKPWYNGNVDTKHTVFCNQKQVYTVLVLFNWN